MHRTDEALPAVPPEAPEPKRIETLDSLRGLAALVVLMHHIMLMVPAFSAMILNNFHEPAHGLMEWILFKTPLRVLWSGREAVILFFVLSGFVLSLPWLNGRPPSLRHFYLKRFCRIYLPYLVAMMGSLLLVSALAEGPLPGQGLWFNTRGWMHAPGPHAWRDSLLMLGTPASYHLNSVTWTLVWEMRVSLVFPFLMLPLMRWRRFGAAGMLIALSLAASLMERSLRDAGGPGANTLAECIAGTLRWSTFFVIGAWLAQHRRVMREWGARHAWLPIFGLAAGWLLLYGNWLVQEDRLSALGAIGILAAILSGRRVESALQCRPLQWLGRVSYSVYLIHVPLMFTLVILTHGRLPLALSCGLMAPLALAGAWAFHHLVELPSAELGKRMARRQESPLHQSFSIQSASA